MRIISFIEDETIIKKILKHLNLWETRIHDPPTDNKNMFNEAIMIPEFYNFTDDVFPPNTYEAGHSAALHCSPCIQGLVIPLRFAPLHCSPMHPRCLFTDTLI